MKNEPGGVSIDYVCGLPQPLPNTAIEPQPLWDPLVSNSANCQPFPLILGSFESHCHTHIHSHPAPLCHCQIATATATATAATATIRPTCIKHDQCLSNLTHSQLIRKPQSLSSPCHPAATATQPPCHTLPLPNSHSHCQIATATATQPLPLPPTPAPPAAH
jgi:hypothetical protein